MTATGLEPELTLGEVAAPVASSPFELVERKGRGHPDTLCDQVADRVSVALCAAYREAIGRVAHHNVDKALLIAGQTRPALGGGQVWKPMRLILSGRATYDLGATRLDVNELAASTAKETLASLLRDVDTDRHVTIEPAIGESGRALADIFAREVLTANDTSLGVGWAPLSPTEQTVLALEEHMQSDAFRAWFPETGEDVKVMAVRRGRRLALTVAAAFVDRHVPSVRHYVERKAALRDALLERARLYAPDLDVDVALNVLDDPGRGEDGLYLTVLGTSAEGADGGEVGRGNGVAGVIAAVRPHTAEAACGKNPVSHVGKIYNVLARELAHDVAALPGVLEASVWLCSQIGKPLDEPQAVGMRLALDPAASLGDVEPGVRHALTQKLQALPELTLRLAAGQVRLV